MVNKNVFDEHAQTYDAWFESHPAHYQAELEALRQLVPSSGRGIEIGVGTGRFAKPLGISTGIEPSAAMAAIAQANGMNIIAGVAENLPLTALTFDYVLFVTTICFLDSLEISFKESFRILKPGGFLIIGFIEKQSELGQQYQRHKKASRFYKHAHFHTAAEIIQILRSTGFIDFDFTQTLFPGNNETQSHAVKKGFDEGAFVVVRAMKPIDS